VVDLESSPFSPRSGGCVARTVASLIGGAVPGEVSQEGIRALNIFWLVRSIEEGRW